MSAANPPASSANLLELTAEVVAAYVENNKIEAAEIPGLIGTVYQGFRRLEGGVTIAGQAGPRPEPAVAIKKSVQPDHIVCLEDGKKLKMLKRHLKTSYNLSPDQYRERWGLPADYPMVAPSYAKTRSKLAKQIGLGTKRRK